MTNADLYASRVDGMISRRPPNPRNKMKTPLVAAALLAFVGLGSPRPNHVRARCSDAV